MNKNSYRIIYNKARNMFMAVAENVKSQSKTSGQSAASTSSSSKPEPIQQEQAFHQLWQVKALVASISFWTPLAPVYADIIADSAANAANRAVIAAGKNTAGITVPVVNIQTPKNGVSHNIYKQFDVLSQGAVINNSRTGTSSQIVGTVAANPFLATGEARVILNEVNSSAASRFEGNLEIAGQMADVIIANPSGINIKGGGFINANKATFTTAKPQLNADGSIQQFTINQGKVMVSANAGSTLGLGGNNNNANYVDIYARALEINAQLHAKNDIQAISGANTISADSQQVIAKTGTGVIPALAVDVKALGGMYANNIYLMGTEQGLGVNNAGTLQAVNNLLVTNAGKIEHTGSMSSTSKTQGLVNLTTTATGVAGDINSSGTISSNAMLNIDSGNNLNLNAKEILINVGGVASSPLMINAKGNLNLAANTRILNDSQGGDLYIDAANLNLANNAQIISNRGSATIQVEKDLIAATGAKFIAAKDLNLIANKDLKLIGNTLQASTGSINLQSIAADAQLLQIDGGTLYASKDLNIYGSGDVSLKNLSFNLVNNATRLKDINIYSGKNLTWDNKTKPLPKISGKVQLEAKQGLDLSGTALHAANGIITQSDTLNLNTTVKSDQGIDLTTQKAMTLAQGSSLTATKDVNLTSLEGDIEAKSLKVDSLEKISVLADKNIILSSIQNITGQNSFGVLEKTTDQTKLNAQKGILIGNLGDGEITLNSIYLDALDGGIQLSGKNAINLDTNLDSTVYTEGILKDFVWYLPSFNFFNAKSIIIENKNKNNNINIKNSTFTSTTENIILNSQAGGLNIESSNFNSKGNTEISAKNAIILNNFKAVSDQHLAINSKQTINQNADYTPLDLSSGRYVSNYLVAKGILSITSTGNQAFQNTQLKGGAILLETNNLTIKQGLDFKATGSDLLKNDTKLNSLNGDLSIQTTGTTGLTIDPKLISMSAIGDIELIAKNGILTLQGYGGVNGNGSEQVVNLNTINGGINLIGRGLNLKGSNLNAYGPIKLVATNGDILVDSVKNTRTNSSHLVNYNSLLSEKSSNDAFIAGGKAFLATQSPTEQILLAILGRQYVLNEIAIAEEKAKVIQTDLQFYSSNLNGFEHKTANIKSTTGDIDINAKKGVMLRATEINTPNKISIEAQGTLLKTITSKEVTDQLDAGILIDGVLDSYELGIDTSANYQVRENFKESNLTGLKGVTIKSLGAALTDNLVLQGTKIKALQGDINLESGNHIQLLTGQDQSYDKSTQVTTKKTWYGKKKTTQTITEAQNYSSDPVGLNARNIFLKSKGDAILYSTEMDTSGFIDIQAKNIKLLATDEIKRKETTSRKKSSFLGLKYNDSSTTASYKEITQLPIKAQADYINTKSEFDTLIQGAEFNYVSGASIVAGGTITLTPVTTLIENTLKKEKNSVVWQSMQDQGSITETAKLPSFNGPVAPKFEAKGGLTVQIPVVSGKNNDVRIEVIKLSNQPGNEYLKALIARKDVNWEAVKLAQENWDYKSQGLTGAGAAILVIIVTIATMGAGTAGAGAAIFGTTTTTTTAMANAFVTSLASQASVSLVNNGGDLGATLKDLGSKDAVKNLVASVVTAGLLSQVSIALKLKPDSTLLSDRLINNFTSSVGSTLVQTAIKGGDLEDNLKVALLAGLAGALQGELASQIGTNLDKVDPSVFEYTIHKIAHAAAGCAAAAATKQSCEAGAIGAGVGEIVAGLMIPEGKTALDLTDAERTKIKDTSKILAGVTAAFAGYDVNTAANSANIAVENNSLGRLVTTAGKAAYKVAKTISELPPAVRANLKPSEIAEMLRKEGVQGVIDIGDNIVTLVSPSSTVGDRAFALIDLAIGVDLKAGKNVDALITDKKIVGKSFPAESLSFDENKFKYLFGKAAYDPHNTPRSLQNKEQLAAVGIFDDNKGRERIIMHLADTVNRSNNISESFTKKINGVDRKFEIRESLLSGPMGVRKAETTFEIMPDGQRRFSTIIIKGGK